MSESHFDRVRQTFAAAREHPKELQAQWLNENVNDQALRNEVMELLTADLEDSFLAHPVGVPVLNWSVENAFGTDRTHSYPEDKASRVVEDRIGPRFRLLQKIGEGGFGEVYMAEQSQPVRRKVAVKILKAGMDSKNIIARFEAERQALALMDHPNIAKVFDGGLTRDGLPFFVMELVQGVAITEFCSTHNYSIRQKLELMVDVCLAIQHAHQKGVIHRDVKPSNILVQEVDGRVAPKVIDFGIAKAIHTPLTDRTLFTEFRQMIGTPEYMSPEQSQTSAVDADTRSDIYALGILLYELITGSTPLDGRELRKLGIAEIQKSIQESEAPPPSTRLSSNQKSQNVGGQGVATKTSRRSVVDSRIDRDLDWIVMKAIEKDRQRRYSTALELSAEVKRWLNGDPIEARPPSILYLASKWFKKHRAIALTATSLLLAAAMAAVGVGFGIAEQRAAEVRRQQSALQVEQASRIAASEKNRVESLVYGNAMIAAAESFANGRKSITRQLLIDCPESQRGAEWQWLQNWSKDHSIVLDTHSKKPIRGVCFLKNADELLSVGDDGVCRIWDVRTEHVQRSWQVTNVECTRATATGSGSMIVTGHSDGDVVVWSRLGERQYSFSSGHSISAMMLNEDETILGVGTSQGDVILLDFPSLTEVARLPKENRYRGPVQSFVFHAPTNRVLVAGKGGTRFYDLANKKVISEFGNYWQSYGVIANRARNEIIAYGPPISVWSLETQTSLREWSLPAMGVWSALSVPDSDEVIVATEDGVIRKIDTTSGIQETLGYGDQGTIHDLASSSDGDSIAIAGEDGTVRIWNRRRYVSVSFAKNSGGIAEIAPIAGGRVVSLSTNGLIETWDLETLARKWSYQGFEQQGFTLASSPSSPRVVAGGYPERLLMWDNTSESEPTILAMALGVRFATMHPNAQWMAGPLSTKASDYALTSAVANTEDSKSEPSIDEGKIALWDLDSKQIVRVFSGLKNWSLGLAFNASGSQLATTSVEGSVLVWEVDSGNEVLRIDSIDGAPKKICFSRNERLLFIGTADGQVLIWDIASNSLLRKLVCHGDEVSSLVTTSDGKRLITTSISDSLVRVWDWEAGQKVFEFDSGLPGVLDARFDATESELFVAGKEHGFRLFRIGSTKASR
jgi:serine/threonine protein kinase/WD40 repeat protein